MLQTVTKHYLKATHYLTYGADALLLTMRLWVAQIFWQSGITKLEDWETTLFLFEEEYQVPFISAEFAAYSSTFFEIAAPILLVLGLGARFATLPLIVMTAVIQFTYQAHDQHFYWAFLLASVLMFGPGRASVDAFIKRYLTPKHA